MMRLLFLCLLLLQAAAAVSEESEGSADGGDDVDDEDYKEEEIKVNRGFEVNVSGSLADKTKGAEETSDQFTMIVIIVAVTALTLSVAAIVTIMLVRRHMNNRQQGIYSVPTEQDQKGV